MNDLIVVENNEARLQTETSKIIIDLEDKIKELSDVRDEIKRALKNEMENKGLKRAIDPVTKLMAIFTPEDKFQMRFDSTALRKAEPDVYDKYVKFIKRESYVSFRREK